MDKSLQILARERVDGHKLERHGEIGEPSNGALMLRLAERMPLSRKDEKTVREHISEVGFSSTPEQREKAHTIIMALRWAMGADA